MRQMTAADLGWTTFQARAWENLDREPNWFAGRILSARRGSFLVWTERGEIDAPARARLVRDPAEKPVTGDWVALGGWPPTVRALLPRRSRLSRKAPGETTAEQVLAANLDVIFIVQGLDRDFNLRRLERYMAAARESGAEPVVTLNKADLCDDVETKTRQAAEVARGAEILTVSAATGQGIDELRRFLAPAKTAVLVGSSGVGKSALTNRLFGAEVRAVGEVRESDGRGRHTTVGREILIAPDGWLLMDLPGIRELVPWSDEGLEQTFDDVEELIASCRFSDCRHSGEPGCAVAEALKSGALETGRWQNYLKLRAEADALEDRREEQGQILSKRKLKEIHRRLRDLPKRRT